MIPKRTFYQNLEIAEKVREVPGCVVECGVWRGGMSAGLCYQLGPDRTYYLFDSFEGMPPAKTIDGNAANQWQRNTSSPAFYDNCKATVESAVKVMEHTGSKDYHIVAGWFKETLPNFKLNEPIALLRLDADWYDSTMTCLNALFDHVADKGIIIIDDYFAWDGCSRAIHDFLSRRSAIERIRTIGDVCYLIKIPNGG